MASVCVCEPADEHRNVEPIWPEDIFVFEVYRLPTLGYVIRGRSGPMAGQLVVLSNFMTKFLKAEATVVLGASKSKKTFCVVILRWVCALQHAGDCGRPRASTSSSASVCSVGNLGGGQRAWRVCLGGRRTWPSLATPDMFFGQLG